MPNIPDPPRCSRCGWWLTLDPFVGRWICLPCVERAIRASNPQPRQGQGTGDHRATAMPNGEIMYGPVY